MRVFLLFFFGSVLMLSGCNLPEIPPSAYGTILESLPDLKEAKEPFSFPMDGENDHQNCVFKESDFL